MYLGNHARYANTNSNLSVDYSTMKNIRVSTKASPESNWL